MKAGLYARRSDDDDARSITRQIQHGRAYVTRKGWTLVEAAVYADHDASGGEFLKRSGFLRLLADAARVPRPFDVLVVSEESRLGRDRVETEFRIKTLVDAGVRIFYFHEDREVRMDSATGSFIEGVRLYAAEVEREKAKSRTYDAMIAKARALHVCGGVTYGYDNHEVLGPNGKRAHVVRRVNAEQAAVVVRIFTLAAEGYGLDRIARTLTAEGIAPPRGGRQRGWAPSAVRAMLRNSTYTGTVTWNRTARVDRGGTRTRRRRDRAEWLTLDAPELRIVADDLWARTHRVLAAKATVFKRAVSGRLIGRPPGTRESPYLLSGLSVCGVCGGTIFATTRAKRANHRGAPGYYRCFLRATRGPVVCANALWLPLADLDALVLDAVRRTILDADLIHEVCGTAIKRIDAERPAMVRRADTVTRQLRALDREIAALEQQLIAGAPWTVVAEPLLARREQRDVLKAEVGHAATIGAVEERLSAPSLRVRVAEELAGWHDLLADREQARPVMKALLDGGRFTFTPDDDGGGCAITGALTYASALARVGGTSVVAPTGFEPVFQSRPRFRQQFRAVLARAPPETCRD